MKAMSSAQVIDARFPRPLLFGVKGPEHSLLVVVFVVVLVVFLLLLLLANRFTFKL